MRLSVRAEFQQRMASSWQFLKKQGSLQKNKNLIRLRKEDAHE